AATSAHPGRRRAGWSLIRLHFRDPSRNCLFPGRIEPRAAARLPFGGRLSYECALAATDQTFRIMSADPTDLAKLRDRIDALDAEMHRLLIQRSQIIDALISVKRTGEAGAAFRPGREAAMMHALVARHEGHLPLVAVEHVWREIISTFTYLQA